jgi:endonuclease G
MSSSNRSRLLLAKLQEIRRREGDVTGHLAKMASRAEGFESYTQTEGLKLDRGQRPVIAPEALEAWQRFEQGKPLDRQDLFHLESIVLGNGLRPAFDIQNDSFEDLPSLWQAINDRRKDLEPLIRGVGRLNLNGYPGIPYAGTAFVSGASCVITNRHVAELFTEGVGAGAHLTFTPGIEPSLDFKQEVTSSASVVVQISATLLVLEEWDIAVLEVAGLPANVTPLPLAADQPPDVDNGMAVVIGYPAFDPAEDLVQQIQIFRSVFNKKRLQPGRLNGTKPAASFGRTVNALSHDCSTLGGNSGSALIDVTTATVVGIHFEGQPLIANYAVPSWVLASGPGLKDVGVQFV